MQKDILPVLILLIIVVVAWIGISVYSGSQNLDIDPNATSFTKNINPKFDLTGFNDFKTRVSALPISPTSFTSLSTTAK
ncbi:MAG TPA: hypothetical protein VHA74_00405 [Candidatus Dojkabacteria bacterium]|nr:hypothetical protein [Candidatus Dojkabacteria bacterium]